MRRAATIARNRAASRVYRYAPLLLAMLVGACLEGRSEDCASSCGPGSVCDVTTGRCACLVGRGDCNNDRDQPGGDGCECSGACDGAVCTGGLACDQGAAAACGGDGFYCSPTTRICAACVTGSYNCDGIDGNGCEATAPCAAATCVAGTSNSCNSTAQYCDAIAASCTACATATYNCDGLDGNGCESSAPCGATNCPACSQTSFCNSSTQQCVTCPAGRYNCDGDGATACEEALPCGASPCDTACQQNNDDDCVWDNSISDCVPCLEDAHCRGNPRSRGPFCDRIAKLCVCDSSDECAGLSAGSTCVQATLFAQVCGCESSLDCSVGAFRVCSGDVVRKCVTP